MQYFSIFVKKFNKACVKFLRVWTKSSNCWEILRKFSKVSDENSIEKLTFLFLFWKIC